MTLFLTIMAYPVVYLIIGGVIARASIPHLWRRAEKVWEHDFYDYRRRGYVVTGAVKRALLWPVMGPMEILMRQVDSANPAEARRREREQQDRIQELERELGMK